MLTTAVLINGGAAILAVIFNVFPKAKGSWDSLSTVFKRLIMAGLIAVWAGVIYAMACAGLLASLNWSLTCDENGLNVLIQLYLAAVGTNTLTYQITSKAKSRERGDKKR